MQQLQLNISAVQKKHTPFDTEAVGSDGALDAGSGRGSRFVWTGVTHQHLTGTAPALEVRGYELQDTKIRLFKPKTGLILYINFIFFAFLHTR